jgi:hypothetical protein
MQRALVVQDLDQQHRFPLITVQLLPLLQTHSLAPVTHLLAGLMAQIHFWQLLLILQQVQLLQM